MIRPFFLLASAGFCHLPERAQCTGLRQRCVGAGWPEPPRNSRSFLQRRYERLTSLMRCPLYARSRHSLVGSRKCSLEIVPMCFHRLQYRVHVLRLTPGQNLVDCSPPHGDNHIVPKSNAHRTDHVVPCLASIEAFTAEDSTSHAPVARGNTMRTQSSARRSYTSATFACGQRVARRRTRREVFLGGKILPRVNSPPAAAPAAAARTGSLACAGIRPQYRRAFPPLLNRAQP